MEDDEKIKKDLFDENLDNLVEYLSIDNNDNK